MSQTCTSDRWHWCRRSHVFLPKQDVGILPIAFTLHSESVASWQRGTKIYLNNERDVEPWAARPLGDQSKDRELSKDGKGGRTRLQEKQRFGLKLLSSLSNVQNVLHGRGVRKVIQINKQRPALYHWSFKEEPGRRCVFAGEAFSLLFQRSLEQRLLCCEFSFASKVSLHIPPSNFTTSATPIWCILTKQEKCPRGHFSGHFF